MNNKIAFGKTFELGFKIFGKTVGWQILYTLVFFVASIIISALSGVVIGLFETVVGAVMVTILSQLVTSLGTTPLTYGFAIIADHAYKGENVDFGKVFTPYKHIFTLFGLYLISTVLTLGVFAGLTYALIGDAAIEFFHQVKDLIAIAQSGSADPADFRMYGESLFGILSSNMIALLLIGLLTMSVSILFFFCPYYAVFANESFSGALNKGLNAGIKNLPMVLAILISLYIAIMMGSIMIALIPILGIFLIMLVILPLIFSFMQAMFRQIEPGESHKTMSDLDEILDVE